MEEPRVAGLVCSAAGGAQPRTGPATLINRISMAPRGRQPLYDVRPPAPRGVVSPPPPPVTPPLHLIRPPADLRLPRPEHEWDGMVVTTEREPLGAEGKQIV